MSNIFTDFYDFWDSHGTKVLGNLAGLLGIATATLAQYPDFASSKVKTGVGIASFVIGAWTVKRGTFNTQQIAQAVVNKAVAQDVPISITPATPTINPPGPKP